MEKSSKYLLFLFLLFVAFWVWAAINPLYPSGWLLENYLVFIGVPLILIAGRYFKLSNISYTLLTIFMILHVIGSHYTYAEVPFGFTLQDWFNSDRNMYDRMVHFSFGFLLAYPIREVFVRLTKAKGFWGYYLPVELTLAFSALYELIEYGAVMVSDPQAGLAFLGAQGDVWDAQKDMLLATLGSIITMFVVFFVNLRYNKSEMKEIKDSFHIPKDDEPLGENKLTKMINASKSSK